MGKMEQVIAAISAFQRELLIAPAAGAAFALFMFLCEPLLKWTTRNEANRLILSEQRRLSTYVLMGLIFGSVGTGLTFLVKLPGLDSPLIVPATLLASILLLIGFLALAIMGRLLAKRLAQQLVALRKPPT